MNINQRGCPVERLDGLRILVVEDHRDSLQLITLLLDLAGAEVRGTERASDALKVLTSWHPDILVSDVAMPEEDGITFIKRRRAVEDSDDGSTPAIALSAHPSNEDR